MTALWRDFLFGCAVTLVGLVLWMLLLETVFRLGGVFGVVLSALAYSAAVTAVLVTGRRDG
jgi:hypothetical protein